MKRIPEVIASPDQRSVSAVVDVSASPERVFDALASAEVTDWWVRPGIFDTREWTGDVQAGGRWHASGIGQGKPYELEGEFTEVDRPHSLGHTWHLVGTPFPISTVDCRLEPTAAGTRITFRHGDFVSPEATEANRAGWETSFTRLLEILEA